jgi:adenylate cyclase
MEFFRRFTSRKVADELWRRRDEFMDGSRPRPQRLVVTALLSDLKGYTEAAEKMDPSDLMEWINTYMDAMTRVIEAHDGHVDDYVGDGIKANFGVPFPSVGTTAEAADARSAVECALEMGEELARLNVSWSEQGLPTGRQRIGLATGPVVVGSVGSAERMKYTTVGDTVNTSARLESFSAPGYDFAREDALYRVLVSESTFRLVGSEFETESIGEHSLKGKGESVRIYRVRRSDSSGVSTPIRKGANNG